MTFQGELIKTSDTLVYKLKKDQVLFNNFKAGLKLGDRVDVYMEIIKDDGTLAQLAKVHTMIRDLSQHLGYNSYDVKLLVKDYSGLVLKREVKGKEFFIPKSFGDCSREELALAIQSCIEIGKSVNLNLY